MNPTASPFSGIPNQPAPSNAPVKRRCVRSKSSDLHCAIVEALMRGKAARASLRKKNVSDQDRLNELRQARQSLEHAVKQVQRALAEDAA